MATMHLTTINVNFWATAGKKPVPAWNLVRAIEESGLSRRLLLLLPSTCRRC
jgi:hypothetical protein